MISTLASKLSHALAQRRIGNHWPTDCQWQSVRAQFPCLPSHPRLRELAALVLAQKEFSAVAPLELTDEMAIAVAAQAALPLLGMSLRDETVQATRAFQVLDLYDDFRGIVLHRSGMLVTRKIADPAGVVHQWHEPIAGEAMDGGPLTLSWQDVQAGQARSNDGFNLVIHEFAHVLDLKAGDANGVPLLPAGFWAAGMQSERATHGGQATAAEAYGHWQHTMKAEYDAFIERLSLAERFGAEQPWLNAYAATAPEEFFAVTAEAYFTHVKALARECPSLIALYDAYFQAWRWR